MASPVRPRALQAAPEQGKLLSPAAYQKLLGRLQKVVRSTDHRSQRARIEGNWQMGQTIVAAKLSQKVGYHNGVLRELSEDSGISVRVLQEAVAFRNAYQEAPAPNALTWSHYRKLMRLAEPLRSQLEAAALAQGWTARDLQAAIVSALPADSEAVPELERPTDPTYLYGATVTQVVDGDTIDADIDLGFQVVRKERVRLAFIDAPEAKSAAGRAAKAHLTRLLHRASTLVLTTVRIDLHGRYVAHVFTSPAPTTKLDCFERGSYLNAQMVSAGHAVVKKR